MEYIKIQLNKVNPLTPMSDYVRLNDMDWSNGAIFGLSNGQRIPRQTASKTGRICVILVLFALGLITLSKLRNCKNNQNTIDTPSQKSLNHQSELLIVNVLFRHGDRAPTDLNKSNMSQLKPHANQIWPNGLGNLTDAGMLRSYKIGLKLSQRYRVELNAHSSQTVLALSSDSFRCIQSLKILLRAFYNFETTLDEGLKQIQAYPSCQARFLVKRESGLDDSQSLKDHDDICSVLNDSGWPDEWKRVAIDSEALVALRSKYTHEKCSNYNQTICPVLESMDESERLITIPGYEELKKQIKSASGDAFNFHLIGSLSDLAVLLRYTSVPAVHKALEPHAKWLFKPVAWRPGHMDLVASDGEPIVMTLYDTLEALNLIGDDICYGQSTAGYLSTSPIITSLVESQMTALNHHNGIVDPTSSWKKLDYSNKRLVLYASHDTVVEMLLRHLEISEPLGNGKQSLENFLNLPAKARTDNIGIELAALLSGVRRSEFGTSIAFELWKTKREPYAYVKLLIYQRDDGLYDDIKFEPVKMGALCRASFRKRYGNSINRFYPKEIYQSIDYDYDCPFELWKNITNNKMISEERFQQLCFD